MVTKISHAGCGNMRWSCGCVCLTGMLRQVAPRAGLKMTGIALDMKAQNTHTKDTYTQIKTHWKQAGIQLNAPTAVWLWWHYANTGNARLGWVSLSSSGETLWSLWWSVSVSAWFVFMFSCCTVTCLCCQYGQSWGDGFTIGQQKGWDVWLDVCQHTNNG